jgi:tryptophanyl-tRNA synthetase
MPRILTGIQSSGRPHLGNILGAIQPAIELSAQTKDAAFFFIADLHALTTVRDANTLRNNTLDVAAAWLACGLNTDKDVFYRQSRVQEVAELTWYLSCFTPYPMLANAHSFKDKAANLANVNAGLFTYPVLMTADIVGYDAELVPVGKDQLQHLEMARDIAGAFNHAMGETFVLPAPKISEQTMTIPGTDGRKMSKSYNNFIDIFLPEKALRKACMGIQTDSTPLADPKNPDTCNVFAIFQSVATDDQIHALRQDYLGGNFGYGQAKERLFQVLFERFADERQHFERLIQSPQQIEEALQAGEAKARTVIQGVLARVRNALGLN